MAGNAGNREIDEVKVVLSQKTQPKVRHFVNVTILPESVLAIGNPRLKIRDTSLICGEGFKDWKIRRFTHSKIQTFKDSKIQRLKHSDIQTSKHSSTQTFKDSRIQLFEDSNIHKFEGSKIRRFQDFQVLERS